MALKKYNKKQAIYIELGDALLNIINYSNENINKIIKHPSLIHKGWP